MNPVAIASEQQTVKGRIVRRRWQRKLLTFLMVFGPGLIVMEADNDAGALSTYVQAGAHYGSRLLWLLLLPITYFVQEMVALMTLMLVYHVGDLAGVFGKH